MELFRREKYLSKIRPFYFADDIIKVITGVRRCGKSSLMQTITEELFEKDIKKENVIFINLDELEYRKIKTADDLETLLLNKLPSTNQMTFLFIDEIQNIKNFEEVINGFRTKGNISVFITGSNSYLLSGELITKLTGRYLEFELFPLSFDEYIQIKKFYSMNVNPNLNAELVNYITEGGFPRTVFFDTQDSKSTYIKGVINEIFEKDIRKRVKIKDTATFETVRQYMINNFGSTTSISNIQKELNKNNINISRETVSKYIKALVDAKILYECDRFDMKSKKSLSGEKKYYLADLSFHFANSTDARINYGPTLENIIYIYAKSFDYAVSIGRIGKLECDFILRNKQNDYSYVQVSYTIALSRETEDREFRPLENIRDNYNKYVATTDYLLQKRSGIKHINLVDFIANTEQF